MVWWVRADAAASRIRVITRYRRRPSRNSVSILPEKVCMDRGKRRSGEDQQRQSGRCGQQHTLGSGKLSKSAKHKRRTLVVIKAPILSTFKRIVSPCAEASGVSRTPYPTASLPRDVVLLFRPRRSPLWQQWNHREARRVLFDPVTKTKIAI